MTNIISIHALREEGDGKPDRRVCKPELISIHALREEGDPNLQHLSIGFFEFLSTPSARRATKGQAGVYQHREISIHALREEGDHSSVLDDHDEPISIHALREEGDRRAVR